MGGVSKLVLGFGLVAFLSLVGSGVWYANRDRGSRSRVSLPDLVPVSIEFVGSEDNFTQVLTVENRGGKAVNFPVSARVELFTAGQLNIGCGDSWTAASAIPITFPIAGGSRKVFQAERSLSSVGKKLSQERSVACKGMWKVEVDYNNAVNESNELNNTASFPNP